jgi:hypothetical protein
LRVGVGLGAGVGVRVGVGRAADCGLASEGCPHDARGGRELWALRVGSIGGKFGRWLTTRSVGGERSQAELGNEGLPWRPGRDASIWVVFRGGERTRLWTGAPAGGPDAGWLRESRGDWRDIPSNSGGERVLRKELRCVPHRRTSGKWVCETNPTGGP